MLAPLLGASAASVLFAVALLASGQNSTITGTLAGQIVMEGFLDIRLPPWLRRLVTRLIAVVTSDRRYAVLRRIGHGATAGAVASDTQSAITVCGNTIGQVHQRSRKDGRADKSALGHLDRMGDDSADYHAQYQAHLRLDARLDACVPPVKYLLLPSLFNPARNPRHVSRHYRTAQTRQCQEIS
jgi:hypothetical protein